MNGPRAWAVIAPDGELAWYGLRDTAEVEAIVGGKHGALAKAMVHQDRRECIRLTASDVALLFPREYAPNPVAQEVLAVLSGGRIVQRWRGAVAISQYEVDRRTGEVLWPGEMSQAWADRIIAAHGEARGEVTR